MSKIEIKYEDFVIIKTKIKGAKDIREVLGSVEHISEERVEGQAPPIKVKDLSTNNYAYSYDTCDLVPISMEEAIEIARLAGDKPGQANQKEAFDKVREIIKGFKNEVSLPETGAVEYVKGERMQVKKLTKSGEKPAVVKEKDITPEAGPCVTVVEASKTPAAPAIEMAIDEEPVLAAAPVQVKQEAQKFGFSMGETAAPQDRKLFPEATFCEPYLHVVGDMKIMLYSRIGNQSELITVTNFYAAIGGKHYFNCRLNYSKKEPGTTYVDLPTYTSDEIRTLLNDEVTKLYLEGKVVKVESTDEARRAVSQLVRSRA
jgi:hypothetical protein